MIGNAGGLGFEDELPAAVAQRVGQARFGFWFGDGVRMGVSGDSLEVGVPNEVVRDWMRVASPTTSPRPPQASPAALSRYVSRPRRSRADPERRYRSHRRTRPKTRDRFDSDRADERSQTSKARAEVEPSRAFSRPESHPQAARRFRRRRVQPLRARGGEGDG